jgi:hypothetical protein
MEAFADCREAKAGLGGGEESASVKVGSGRWDWCVPEFKARFGRVWFGRITDHFPMEERTGRELARLNV